MPDEPTATDDDIVARTRRRHLLDEHDRAQQMITRLEGRLALVRRARADIVEQMRRLDGDD